jgi:hypothetical protein
MIGRKTRVHKNFEALSLSPIANERQQIKTIKDIMPQKKVRNIQLTMLRFFVAAMIPDSMASNK